MSAARHIWGAAWLPFGVVKYLQYIDLWYLEGCGHGDCDSDLHRFCCVPSKKFGSEVFPLGGSTC
jgi:hypothetical protein